MRSSESLICFHNGAYYTIFRAHKGGEEKISYAARGGGPARRAPGRYAWMASRIDWFSVWVTCEQSWTT